MDKQLSNKTKNSRRGKTIFTILLIAGVIAASLWGVRKLLNKPKDLTTFATAVVTTGSLENTISANGLIKPSSELVLTSPISTRIKAVKKENGETVNSGQVIMTLDTEFAQLEYQRLQDEVKLQENNVNRLQLQLQKNIRDIELDDEIQNLRVQNLTALLSDARRLNEIGGATKEEVEQAEQSVNIARLEKKKLENELNYRRSSFASDVLNEEIQTSISDKRLSELGKKIRLTNVTSYGNGVITWLNNNIGSQVSEGDPLVRIANLSSYSIDATASDIHSEKIKIGQVVNVKINRDFLSGRISQILPAVENNTVQFRIELDEPDSEKLRPNMRVDVRIVTSRREEAVYVSNGPAFTAGKIQNVFVVTGDAAERREVEIGFVNQEKVEILSGLAVGETIIISDITPYKNRSSIPLK